MPSDGGSRARFIPDSVLRAPADNDRVAVVPAAGDDGSADWVIVSALGGGGGGGSAGSPIVRKFSFAYNTANILTGATVFTPTVGDVLLDAWVEINTAWDGTSPLGDFGMFNATNQGWLFYTADGPIEMSTADSDTLYSTGVLAQTYPSNENASGLSLSFLKAFSGAPPMRNLPAKFTAADPIKVCVSQDGTNTGADPESTQGAAVLYLVTASPV